MNKRIVSVVLSVFLGVISLDTGIYVAAEESTDKISEQNQTNEGFISASKDKLGGVHVDESELDQDNLVERPEQLDELKARYSNKEYGLRSSIGKNQNKPDNIDWSTVSSAVDNSKSEYFPEITNQHGGSCVFNSIVYYQLSYMVNRELNRPINGDNHNIMSPEFVYNMTYNSNGDKGSNATAIYDLLEKYGSTPLSNVLEYYDKQNSNDNFFTTSFPEQKIWEEAQQYKISNYYYLHIGDYYNNRPVTSPKCDNLYTIKKLLDEGEIFSFSTNVSFWEVHQLSNDSKYTNEYICTQVENDGGDPGPHEMTVVGYDDDICFDINGDETIEDGEKGAFKIANSWGDGFDNDGYVWLSYDALNKVSSVANENMNSEKREAAFDSNQVFGMIPNVKNNDSGLYLLLSVDTDDVSNDEVKISRPDGSNEISLPCFYAKGTETNLNGTDGYSSGTIVVDLSNIYKDVSIDDIYNRGFKITVYDKQKWNHCGTEIDDISIIDKKNNKIYDGFLSDSINVNDNTVSICTNNKDISAPANLKATDNGQGVSLTWDKSQSKDTKISGYMIYRNDALIAKTEDTSYLDNISLDNEYEYKVIAYDNKSLCSVPSSVKIGEKKINNLCKVYYKSNANMQKIHFKIGNEGWTTPPGVDMKKSADKPGYYEYDVDLSKYSDDTVVTACFYNGYWDNNHNNNYVLKKGINIIDNGKLTSDTSNYPELKINDIMTSNKPQVDICTKLSANITGGSGDYETKYEIKGTINYNLDGYSNTIASWFPNVPGPYDIKCTVTDKKTKTSVSMNKEVTVCNNDFQITDLYISGDNLNKIGSNIQINAKDNSKIANISPTIKVLFNGEESKDESCYMYKNYDHSGIYIASFAPKKAGTYTFVVRFTDSVSGVYDEKQIEYKVDETPLKIESINAYYNTYGNDKKPVDTIKLGEDISLKAAVSGGKPEYNYQVKCKKDNEEYKVVKDYEPYGGHYFAPTEAGDYEFLYSVKDGNDNVTSETFKLKVLNGDFAISNFKFSQEGQAPDATVKLSFDNKYGEGTAKYQVIAEDKDINEKTIIQDYSSNNVVNWKPAIGGNYNIIINAIDSKGNKTTSENSVYVISKPITVDLGVNKSEVNYGDDVTLNFNAKGGTRDFKYNIYAYDKNKSRYTIAEGVKENSYVWKSNIEGKVTIEVQAIDMNSSFGNSNIDINVASITKCTIYYKGYNNAKIHYTIGDNVWQTKDMQASSDISGYDRAITIDLGNKDKLTACFTDGNGHWDSNNGKNYEFKPGYYTYSNGIITKIN